MLGPSIFYGLTNDLRPHALVRLDSFHSWPSDSFIPRAPTLSVCFQSRLRFDNDSSKVFTVAPLGFIPIFQVSEYSRERWICLFIR